MRSNEMSVVLFGGLDGLVAEQMLYGANIGAVGEQLDGEGVTEAVRTGGDAGELANSGDRAGEVLAQGVELAIAGPEEVGGVGCGQSGEGCRGVGVELDLERHFGLHHAKREVAGGGVEGTAAELGHVGDAEAGVEQSVDQGAGAVAKVRGLGRVVAGDAVRREDELGDFLVSEGQGGDAVHFGHADFPGRVIDDPFAIHAPGEERAQHADLFALGRGFDRARVTVTELTDARATEAIDGRGVEGGECGRVEEGLEVSKQMAVDVEGRSGELATLQVGGVGLDRSAQGDGAGVGQEGLGLAALQEIGASLGALPVAGPEGAADGLLVWKRAVDPDGAVAKGKALTLMLMGAVVLVASVGVEHGVSLPFLYAVLYGGLSVRVSSFNFNKIRGGRQCESNALSSRILRKLLFSGTH
jgi:hypothetical protein